MGSIIDAAYDAWDAEIEREKEESKKHPSKHPVTSSIKNGNKAMTEDYKKRYEEALERARDMLSYKEVRQEDMEYLFPELKEDEDEKIRKEIIRIVDGYFPDKASTQREKYIAWLEKKEQVAWSKKDIKMIDSIIEEVRPCGECPDYPTDEERDYFYKGQDRVEWLERLKKSDNAKWWPSKLQLNCLSDAVDAYHKQGYPAEVLTSLLDDLKKYRRGAL